MMRTIDASPRRWQEPFDFAVAFGGRVGLQPRTVEAAETLMNDVLRNLMSGRSRGILPATARGALRAASLGYGIGVRWRNRRFDCGRGVEQAAVPVISVGNLTAGGTGKTPVVALLANYFAGRGTNAVLLSRGYRALTVADDASQCGNDEARVLERLCPGVPHLQQPDRVAAARDAVDRHGARLLILDDGFQHRRLARDLDLVLIDAVNPFGYGHLLPRGLLREPIASLQRADLVLLTRCDAIGFDQRQSILRAIREVVPSIPVVDVAFPPRRLVNVSGVQKPFASLTGLPVLSFCGIGNPSGFERTLEDAGLRPVENIAFADHHHYRPADLFRLGDRAEATGAAAAVTTLKDLVKLRSDVLPGPRATPLWAVETGCDLVSNGEALYQRLDGFLEAVASRRAA